VCRLLTIVAGWMWLLVAVILVALLCTAVRHSAGRASASPKPLRRVMLLNLLFAASARSLFFLADPFYGKRRLPALVVAFAYGLPYPALNSATALLFVSTRHFFSRTMRGQSGGCLGGLALLARIAQQNAPTCRISSRALHAVSMFVARRGLFNMVIVCSALEYVVQIFADVARCLGHTWGLLVICRGDTQPDCQTLSQQCCESPRTSRHDARRHFRHARFRA
jgi:hypothetical protein